ncbi:uncharacterized protein LOC125004397 [Mugil cephalus]|uniref:uncharacterized protein LOC125004397 n=1 Tax=Mugil cephalus TaxID=48193 RepID=UPI001FB63669|nr:uncharacterized protein LOC125004397 [Mugil cephalus]
MDGLCAFAVVLLAFSWSQHWIYGSKVTVRPGDNVTLYCDCRPSSGVYIVWFRNCSHENQPTFVLSVKDHYRWTDAHFKFVKNVSTDSYDLLIRNITSADEGLYYCGTEKTKVEDKEFITTRHIYKYGNTTTTVTVELSSPNYTNPVFDPDSTEPRPPSCSVCWMLLFSLCPLFAGVSSLLSSLLVCHLCRKRGEKLQADHPNPEATSPTQQNQGEDVCYAALEIRQPSRRPKKERLRSSDFSTYSAVRTSGMEKD